MNARKALGFSSAVSLAGLLCWTVMFLAGQDVWHDLGRPGFWGQESPPNHDLRVFAFAFYALLFVLLAGFAGPVLLAIWSRRPGQKPA